MGGRDREGVTVQCDGRREVDNAMWWEGGESPVWWEEGKVDNVVWWE